MATEISAVGSELQLSGIQTFVFCRRGKHELNSELNWNKLSHESNGNETCGHLLGVEEMETIPFLTNEYLVQSSKEEHTWFLCKKDFKLSLLHCDGQTNTEASLKLFYTFNQSLKSTTLVINVHFGESAKRPYQLKAPRPKQSYWGVDDIIRLAFSCYDKGFSRERRDDTWKSNRPHAVTITSSKSSAQDFHSLRDFVKWIWPQAEPPDLDCRILQINHATDKNGKAFNNVAALVSVADHRRALCGMLHSDEGWESHPDEYATIALADCFAPRTFCHAYISGNNSLCIRLSTKDTEAAINTKKMLDGLADPKLLAFHNAQDQTAGLKTGLFTSILKHLEFSVYMDGLKTDVFAKSLTWKEAVEQSERLSEGIYELTRRGIAGLDLLDSMVARNLGTQAKFARLNHEFGRLEERIKRTNDENLNLVLMVLTVVTVGMEFFHLLHDQYKGNERTERRILYGCGTIAVLGLVTLGFFCLDFIMAKVKERFKEISRTVLRIWKNLKTGGKE